MAVLRVLETSKTGRDFIQSRGIPTTPGLTRANYFDGLGSSRRLRVRIHATQGAAAARLFEIRAYGSGQSH